ncbi:MAG: helix-turn-helix transcriptional regulator [Bacteroidaceae bacterium]|nr:helix-turn-helix transcriptional regulator [Bacteroidaceae bacterium]MBQ3196556.1 helix-turn-helix transcriptional regulator [Alistipes sp.]
MKLGLIRNLCEKRAGGMRQLASDIGMSEANLHRCVNNNKIQAADLEQIALRLGVDIRQFFDDEVKALANNTDTQTSASMPIVDDNYEIKNDNNELISLCRTLVENYQQRDDVMNKLVSMISCL